MRILGLDYGQKRIGVALCDELGMTAQALEVIERKNIKKDMEALGRIVRNYEVEKIVIGYPLQLNGTCGRQCAEVDRFIVHMEAALSVPVLRWDETLSTKDAEEILRNANVKVKKRKALIDKMAAGFILQRYLDSQRERK